LEDTFEAREDYEGFALAVVVDYAEFDFAVTFFDDSGLVGEKPVSISLSVIARFRWGPVPPLQSHRASSGGIGAHPSVA
jgi:hypothetical protein